MMFTGDFLAEPLKINGFDTGKYFKLENFKSYGYKLGPWELFYCPTMVNSGAHFMLTTYKSEPYRYAIFNTSEHIYDMPWNVHRKSGAAHLLGPQEGVQWISKDVADKIAPTAKIPSVWDNYMDYQALSDNQSLIDPNPTYDAGSANMEFSLPEGLVALKEGMTGQKLRWFLAYQDIQLSRSRYRWYSGLPFGANGKVLPEPIPGFDPWKANQNQRNAYDLGHFDAAELFWGFHLTGDPTFLLDLIHLWCHAYAHCPPIYDPRTTPNARQIGWPMIVADYILRATATDPYRTVFEGLRSQITGYALTAMDWLVMSYPIWDLSAVPSIYLPNDGSPAVPYWVPDAKKETYFHLWHYTPAVVAACRLRSLDSTFKSLADDFLDHMVPRIDEAFDPESGTFAIKVGKSGWLEKAKPDGVADWYATLGNDPRYRTGPWSSIAFATQSLVDRYGKKENSPYYYSFGLGKVPWAFGYSQGPFEIPLT